MEVKPGYKQTEVGVIPEEWEVKPLSAISCKVTDGDHLTPMRTRSGYYLLSARNVRNGLIDLGDVDYVGVDEYRRMKQRCNPEAGDLLISCSGNGFGRVAIVPKGLECVLVRSAALVKIDHLLVDSGFVQYWLQGTNAQAQISNSVSRAAQPNLFINNIERLQCPISPSVSEQRAIATALSDVDGLLGGLDRLIAKKRDLKQAAMQQLLTGQTRLPGFHGEWEETTFASVVRHHAGNSTLIKGKLPSSEATGRFPAYSASGQDVWCDHFEHEGDAIVVSAVGSRCGKAFKASGKWCAIANTHVVWPNPAKIDTRFLAYFINDEDFWQKSGTGQPFVLFTKTFARPLRLPPHPEQTAIASVLTEMDGELAVLEQRREKTRALKQAMMQELLTGRVRLVESGELTVDSEGGLRR